MEFKSCIHVVLDNKTFIFTMSRYAKFPYNEGSEKSSHPAFTLTDHYARRDDCGSHMGSDREHASLRVRERGSAPLAEEVHRGLLS